jgi:hypothetical protein
MAPFLGAEELRELRAETHQHVATARTAKQVLWSQHVVLDLTGIAVPATDVLLPDNVIFAACVLRCVSLQWVL